MSTAPTKTDQLMPQPLQDHGVGANLQNLWTPAQLIEQLGVWGIDVGVHHHAPVFTTQEAAHLFDTIKGQHCKNLFVRDRKGRMALVVLPDDLRADLGALAHALGYDRLSFGSPERLLAVLGVTPGSVCPFAVIHDRDCAVQVVLDTGMMQADLVNYHPLINSMTLTLTPAGLLRFFEKTGNKPVFIDLRSMAAA